MKFGSKKFFKHVVSPAILAIVLFEVFIFVLFIPSMRTAMIEKKKETIKELTLVVMSELNDLHQKEQAGVLLQKDAQALALAQIKNIRYGDENKDYFWVTDTHPTLLMHPYRDDLDGSDVSLYADPAGKRLFAEFVRAVEGSGQAYVDYLWQWKDDPSRVVPKLSYVHEFKPWGWIVGTGIYLEDVRLEIAHLIKKLVWATVVISALLALLLAYIAKQAINLERAREKVARALLASEEKYRRLVESSTEGMALCLHEHITYANQTLLTLLGYTLDEITQLTINDIFPSISSRHQGGKVYHDFPDKAFLQARDGRSVDVIVSCAEMNLEGRAVEFFTFKNISSKGKPAEFLSQMLGELQRSLLMPSSSVSQFMKPSVECDLNTSVAKAMALMTSSNSNALVVKGATGEAIGVVTDRDLRTRVYQPRRDVNQPISTIMTSPIITIAKDALLFEATMLFQSRGIHHLAVADDNNHIVGMISTDEVMQTQRHPASVLIKELQQAKTADDALALYKNVPSLVRALLDNDAKVESVARVLSSASDALTSRFIQLAINELGLPPSAFAFVVFGSEARGEQTLRTDIDNGIIFDDPKPEELEVTQKYFLQLGTKVCSWLNAAGYDYCRGDVMAQNRKWCQPLSVWEKYFVDTVSTAKPEELAIINIIFDFKTIYGDLQLTSHLRQALLTTLKNAHAFFFEMAQITLQYKPPLGFFGNIQTESSDDRPPAFNVKAALLPLVNFARIYALQNGIEDTATLTRLNALHTKRLLVESSLNELTQAFCVLLKMRLSHQANQILHHQKPDNLIELSELSQIEKTLLKKILSDILVFQARVSRDFARVV